eukprot:CAMPEP_0197606508 /NCGR_PEP_ID=MMETSP1326-20131121/45194_1 /TAXON_ID=1155430 /ORGANISM="Genus nov. species nov., Strain RCC2288" /LENGTH=625 /DNA_ID=CAMNT_0043174433 /DNA_START=168 /DNA_END=2045 /DNA_ORIENTATION=-
MASTDVEKTGGATTGGGGMIQVASFGDLNMDTSGVRITAKNLTYSVPSFKDAKVEARLLNEVSAVFNPGEMTALLGPSGSGKTTFLDVLAGRKSVGTTTGTLLFGGMVPNPQFMRRYTGYVEQFDTLIAALTVREMLLYTAELKRPREELFTDKEKEVDKLIKELGLWEARDVVVGSEMVKGISGGQKKRTNIAIALITNPSVLFLDEPTSGLDSFTANEVMSVVKSLVTNDTTIIATIHSPTAYAFSLFNNAMILCSGMQVYFGPNGAALMTYAQTSLPGVQPKGDGHSNIEWLIDVFTAGDRRGDSKAYNEVYMLSSLKKESDAMLVAVAGAGKMQANEETARQLAATDSTATPGWWAFWIMVKYRTRKNYSDGEFLGPRLGDKVFLSILIFTLYWGIGNKTAPENVVNISAMLFMWTTLPAFGAASYVPQIVMERSLYMRERADGLYKPITYLLAKMFDEMMLLSFVSLIIACIVFYAVDLQGSFLVFWLVYYLTLGNGVVLAYLISALAPNMEAANALLPTYVVTLLFFAGFLIRPADTPVYWQWYTHIDLMKYSWGALMVNQWEGKGDMTSMSQDGVTVLQQFDLDNLDKWNCLGYLMCFFVVFFTLALLALTFVNHSRR